MCDAFLKRLGRDPGTLSSKLKTKLMAHRWPGNVEELRDVVERMAALAGGGRRRIDPDMVATTISAQGARWRGMTFKDAKAEVVEIFEREYLADLLRRHTGNISAAAREAKIDRNYIHRLVKKYHLDVPR